MIAACPKCKARFKIDESKMAGAGVKLRCSKCRTVFAVRKKAADRETKAPSAAAKSYKVLIANSDADICSRVEEILKTEDFEVLKAYDGVDALAIIEKNRPHVAILDVALPMMYGFEVCEHVKGHLELKEDVKVILIASIYDKTRYKRNPTSLYGADDFIEIHHLLDDIVPKINRLIFSSKHEPAAVGVPQKEAEEAVTREVKPEAPTGKDLEILRAGEKVIDDKDKDVQEKARRLARIIVSDIALYNGDLVSEGVRNGNLYKLLKDDIKEGLEHFKKKVSPSISAEAYLKEAFQDFISKRKVEMGL
ncbi:MAG: response regulator receiver protein [Deltaproteobacteria bacterium]|nr:response regulator receiver protein [Deltaproteobacteria bacterium]